MYAARQMLAEQPRRRRFASPADMAVDLSRGQWKVTPHLKLLSDALVDVVNGTSPRLIVEAPPRHGKSQLVSHWLNVWLLNEYPEKRVILTSYEADFAASWGRQVRNTVQEHQDRLRVRIASDSSAANRWHTTLGGGMTTAGARGAITGRGADWLTVDDATKNSIDAGSATMRKHTWEWWQSTARTRLEPGAGAVIIQTRWHEDDLVGRLRKEDLEGTGENWRVISLPAVAESETDPLGRAIGEPLWPERFDAAALEKTKVSVGPYVWDALYQGRPTAKGGSIFQRKWWETNRYYPTEKIVGRWVSWDTALKAGENNAYTAMIVFELTADYRLLVRHAWRERVEFPDLPNIIENKAHEWNWDELLQGIIIEDKASGTPAIQTLRSAAPALRDLLKPINPSGDKEQRAKQAAVWCANGSVMLPHPSQDVPWLHDFESELFEFPRSAFADQVDAFSQGVIYVEHLLRAGLEARLGGNDDSVVS